MTGTYVLVVVTIICVGDGDESFVNNMKLESLTLVDYIFCFDFYEWWQLYLKVLRMCLCWQPQCNMMRILLTRRANGRQKRKDSTVIAFAYLLIKYWFG